MSLVSPQDTELDEAVEVDLLAAQAHTWKTRKSIEAGPQALLPDGLQRVDRELFDHQKHAVRRLQHWLDTGEGGGVLCLPTGGGKTRTAVAFALRNIGPRFRVLWLAHRTELVTQAIATFVESSKEAARIFLIGRFDAQAKVAKRVDIVVASIPTLTHTQNGRFHNLELLKSQQEKFNLVIVDECHHGVASTWQRLISSFKKDGSRVLGLSATPTRTNEKERSKLWELFNDVLYEVPLVELIRHKILSEPRPIAVSSKQSYRATFQQAKEYKRFDDIPPSLVKQISEDGSRNEVIVGLLKSNSSDYGQTLTFCGERCPGPSAQATTSWRRAFC